MVTAASPDRAVAGEDEPAERARHVAPRFARWPVLAIALVVAVAHGVAATRRGRWYDEALMLAIGRHHLDWGAADQPPVTPLLAALADRLAPGSQIVLELPAIAATALAVVLASLVAREIGGDAHTQTLSALAQATGLWVATAGHWLTPYSLEPMLWLAIGWLVVRWLRTRRDHLLLWLGLVIGLGAETKFQVMLLAVVLVISVALLGPRELLRRPLLWVGTAMAVLIAAPTLLWQARNGWPQIALAKSIALQAVNFGGRSGIATGLLTSAGALGLVLAGLGLVALVRSPEFKDLRFLAVAFVILYVVFVIPPGRPNYLAGFYGLLVAVGALALQRRREAGRARWPWLVWPLGAISAAMALWTLAGSVAQASPLVADTVVSATAQAYRSLPAAQRDRTIVMGDTFMYAAYLDAAPSGTGLPVATSGNVSYGYFPAPSEDHDSVLLVGTGPSLNGVLGALRYSFTEARPVAEVPALGARGLYGGSTPTSVWLLTGRRVPWAALWPAMRSM